MERNRSNLHSSNNIYKFMTRQDLGLKYNYGDFKDKTNRDKFVIDFNGEFINSLSLNEVLLIIRCHMYTVGQVTFPSYWKNQGLNDVQGKLDTLCKRKYISYDVLKMNKYFLLEKGERISKTMNFLKVLENFTCFTISDKNYESIHINDFLRNPELKRNFLKKILEVYQNNILCHLIYSDIDILKRNIHYYCKMMERLGMHKNSFEASFFISKGIDYSYKEIAHIDNDEEQIITDEINKYIENLLL